MAVASPVRLSEADRCRARHHLGYVNVEPASSIALGFPSATQPQFLLEIAMDRLIPEAVGKIQKELAVLDCIEEQQIDALKRLKFQQVAEVKLRNSNEEPHEQDLLQIEYRRWQKKLASDLGVELNPYSVATRSTGMNIPVAIP